MWFYPDRTADGHRDHRNPCGDFDPGGGRRARVGEGSDLTTPGSTLLYGDVSGGGELSRTALNPRHKDRVNLAYADGHVGSLALSPELVGTGDAIYLSLVWPGQ